MDQRPVPHIPIIDVNPGAGDSPLEGSLSHFDLQRKSADNDHLKFRALSYVWGSSDKLEQLVTPEGFIPLTKSLNAALRRLRDPNETTTIWTDAICINQDDNAEKGSQVRMMGDIYKSAEVVIADLGDDGDDSSVAMDLLYKVANYDFGTAEQRAKPLFLRDIDLPPMEDPGWEAVRAFFRRPWFRRVWIVQEFVVAKNVWFFFGDTSTEWENIGGAIANANLGGLPYFTHCSDEDARIGAKAMYSLMFLRGSYQNGKRHDLIDLLKLTREFFSTKGRDRYFSMLGLAGDVSDPSFEPDYSSPFEQIARRYANVYVSRGRGLELIYQSNGSSHSKFPSWIPDWTRPQACGTGLWYQRDAKGPPNAYFFSSGGQTVQNLEYDKERDVLLVDGVLVDMISAIGSNHHLAEDSSAELKSLKRYISDSDNLMKGLNSYTTGEDLNEVQWRTLIANMSEGVAPAPKSLGDAFHALREYAWEIDNLRKSKLDDVRDQISEIRRRSSSFELPVMRVMDGRAFTRTTGGFVGVVPFAAQVGDSIAVFFGSRVPVVLRQHPSRIGLYIVIGECYIHGIMKGEALQNTTEPMKISLA